MGNVVYSKVLTQPNNPSRSRGCGIVEFETVQEAQLALQQLQNSELDGRQVKTDKNNFQHSISFHKRIDCLVVFEI